MNDTEIVEPLIEQPTLVDVLIATLRVHERDGRCTVRTVAKQARLRSTETAHRHLSELRRLGLVDWRDGTAGTLRPTARAVPFGVRPKRAAGGMKRRRRKKPVPTVERKRKRRVQRVEPLPKRKAKRTKRLVR